MSKDRINVMKLSIYNETSAYLLALIEKRIEILDTDNVGFVLFHATT